MNNPIKCVRVGIRFQKDELLHLEQLAKQAGVKSLSEYVRMRLLNDEMPNPTEVVNQNDDKADFGCDHERELMKLMLKTFILTREIARKNLENEKFLECSDIATAKLKEWNYIE